MGHKLVTVIVLLAGILSLPAIGIAQEGTPQSGASGQSVMIAETEVSWSGAWEFDEDASSDEIVTLTIVDEESLDPKLATYAELTDETVDEAGEALDVFVAAFLSAPGVSDAVEIAAGELNDYGTVWKVFTYDLSGVAIATVFTVSEREDNDFVVSTVTATLPRFAETIAEAQEQILLDGETLFLRGIDSAGLLQTPAASPQAIPER